MLAPPEKRRAADRKRKRRQVQRERQGLRRCQLWLSDHAHERVGHRGKGQQEREQRPALALPGAGGYAGCEGAGDRRRRPL
jgi:hypothetical protein